jgi:hypothetical protein
MRKAFVTAFVAVLALAALAFTGAANADPGPNGKNDFGLCKAYLNGSENKRDKGPFPALEQKAAEAGEDVEGYCRGVFPGGKDSSPGNSGVNGADNPSPQG